MNVELLKGLKADFIAATWPGRNTSGLVVYGNNVLVRMDECSPITAGGIMRLDDDVEKLTAGAETGCIYAIGPAAFAHYYNGKAWTGAAPGLGERVYVEKFAGLVARGKDGALYRVMSDNCIAAGLDPDSDEEADQKQAAA